MTYHTRGKPYLACGRSDRESRPIPLDHDGSRAWICFVGHRVAVVSVMSTAVQPTKWKADWPQAKANLVKWWDRTGLALCLTSSRMLPIEPILPPRRQQRDLAWWTDPIRRTEMEVYRLATTHFFAEAFPVFETQIGPGSLGSMLGAVPHFDVDTIWYAPCIDDPDTAPPIRLDIQDNPVWDAHLDIIGDAVRHAEGRYLVSIPDLIENLDTLAALRGSETLLCDLIDRPAWVHDCLNQITEAYAQAYDVIYDKVQDADGGSAYTCFSIWGPGKTAKVQCDFSCMISPDMYREFFLPYLRRQCERLDYVLYHLDGVEAVKHLDSLLAVESIQAIQWVSGAGQPTGGDPCWYELYRRILGGGKGLQVKVAYEQQIVPLIETLGPEGLFIRYAAPDEGAAQSILRTVEPYR